MATLRVLTLFLAASLMLIATSAAQAQNVACGANTRFVRYITNPFFPLLPGTTFYYKGEKEGVKTTDIMTVTDDVKCITGVQTTVVRDRAFEEGVLVEDTIDWYAQDTAGNVWYFGEDTKELAPDGTVVSTEGSWQAGVNGAKPGIIMEAHPKVGDRYFQEFAQDVAEDQARVLSLDKEACVKYGCFDDLLVTREWSRLTPGEVEHKYYARDVGFILGVIVKGGDERTELVRITHGWPTNRN
jgi:hypothetical protein